MSRNTLPLTPELAAYLLEHSSPLPPIAVRLIEETIWVGKGRGNAGEPRAGPVPEAAGQNHPFAPGTGNRHIHRLLVADDGLRRSRTGGLPRHKRAVHIDRPAVLGGGRLRPCHRPSPRAGAGVVTDPDDDDVFDFVFIDADKSNYTRYFELSLDRLEPDGLIAVDNTLWSGRVLDPSDQSTDTQAIKDFNEAVAADDRVEALILPIGDGLTLIRRR